MKKLFLIAAMVFASMALTGCYESVPPGHKGKILGPDGYSPEVLGEGRHWVGWREDMVLLDLTTNRWESKMSVTMKDYDSDGKARPGLDMDFVLSYRFRLRDNQQIINTMFHDIKVDKQKGVTADAVFNVYALPLVQTTFRDTLSRWTPEEALASRDVATKEVSDAVKKVLANSPIEISDVVIVRMDLPDTIVNRIKTNKDRELKIAEEQAQQAIELTKRENAIVLARKEAERNLIDAQAAARQNAALTSGLNTQVLELRRLEIQKIYAEAFAQRFSSPQQGDVTFMPYDAMSSPGAQNRMFGK